MMNDLVRPTPRIEEALIPLIKKAIVFIKGLFTRPKQGEPPEAIAERNRQLRAFCDHVNENARQVELRVVEDLKRYGDFLMQLSQRSDLVALKNTRINTAAFARQIDLLCLQIPGLIASEVSKRLSETDPEYQRILWMQPGMEKENAMTAFCTNIINTAVEKCAVLADEIIDSIQNDFFAVLMEEQERSQQQLKKTEAELNRLLEAAGDAEQQAVIVSNAKQVLFCCSLVSNLLE